MFAKILAVIAIIEITWGTIFAVLGILKMSFMDIRLTQSCKSFNSVDESNLLQRYYARTGIGYIVTGSFLQIYLTFMEPSEIKIFLLILTITMIVPIILHIKEKRRYNNELEKLKIRKAK